MIRAIVFDCFGVLATEGWVPFRDEYFAKSVVKSHEANVLMRQLVTGQITDGEFRKVIASMAGVTPEVVHQRIYTNIPNDALLDYIRTLKHEYKIAILSNVGKNRLREIFTSMQLTLFDVCALSSETGYAKPDIMAYRHVAQQLDVPTEQCVFVDDQPRYLEGAKRAGMQAILYRNFVHFQYELEKLFADS